MNLKDSIIPLVITLCLNPIFAWGSVGFRSMTCTIGGCPQGQLKLKENFATMDFSFSNHHLENLSLFDEPLKELGLIEERESVDYAFFSLSSKSCEEARDPLGVLYCKEDNARFSFRVRGAIQWDEKTQSTLFAWRTIEVPLGIELHPSPSATGMQDYVWNLVLVSGEKRSFALLDLYHCTFGEPMRNRRQK